MYTEVPLTWWGADVSKIVSENLKGRSVIGQFLTHVFALLFCWTWPQRLSQTWRYILLIECARKPAEYCHWTTAAVRKHMTLSGGGFLLDAWPIGLLEFCLDISCEFYKVQLKLPIKGNKVKCSIYEQAQSHTLKCQKLYSLDHLKG